MGGEQAAAEEGPGAGARAVGVHARRRRAAGRAWCAWTTAWSSPGELMWSSMRPAASRPSMRPAASRPCMRPAASQPCTFPAVSRPCTCPAASRPRRPASPGACHPPVLFRASTCLQPRRCTEDCRRVLCAHCTVALSMEERSLLVWGRRAAALNFAAEEGKLFCALPGLHLCAVGQRAWECVWSGILAETHPEPVHSWAATAGVLTVTAHHFRVQGCRQRM